MKYFNKISKVLLIVIAIVGLTIGMSTITGCSNSSDNSKTTVQDDVDKSAVNTAKCGGDDTKEAVTDAKCGEGKCREGKCGGDEAKTAVSDKVDEAKAVVSDKADEAKCSEGKCG